MGDGVREAILRQLALRGHGRERVLIGYCLDRGYTRGEALDELRALQDLGEVRMVRAGASTGDNLYALTSAGHDIARGHGYHEAPE